MTRFKIIGMSRLIPLLVGIVFACSQQQSYNPNSVDEELSLSKENYYHIFIEKAQEKREEITEFFKSDDPKDKKKKAIYLAAGTATIVGAGIGLRTIFQVPKEKDPRLKKYGDRIDAKLVLMEGEDAESMFRAIQSTFDANKNAANIAHVGLEFGEAISSKSGQMTTNLVEAQNLYQNSGQRAFNALAITPFYSFNSGDTSFVETFNVSYPLEGKNVNSKVYVKQIDDTFNFAISAPNGYEKIFDIRSANQIDELNDFARMNFALASAALTNKLKSLNLPIHVVQTTGAKSAYTQLAMKVFASWEESQIKRVHAMDEVDYTSKQYIDEDVFKRVFKKIYRSDDLTPGKSGKKHLLAAAMNSADYIISSSKDQLESLRDPNIVGSLIQQVFTENKKKFQVIEDGIVVEKKLAKSELERVKEAAKRTLNDLTDMNAELRGRRLRDNNGKPTYLYIGALDKNADISIVEKASKKLGDKGNLVIVTNADFSDPKLKKLARNSKIRIFSGASQELDQSFVKTLRQASDFAFIAGGKSGYGAVAIDGLLPGKISIQNGYQDLEQSLKDIRKFDTLREEVGNAFLFGSNKSTKTLEKAIEESLELFNEQETFKEFSYLGYRTSRKQFLQSKFDKNHSKYINLYNEVPEGKVFKISKNGVSKTIRFAHSDSIGKTNDKIIFVKGLIDNGYRVSAMNVGNDYRVDLNFHIELVERTDNARKNWLMANQEFLEADQLKKVDKIICRHKLCSEVASKMLREKNLSTPVETIKFTSLLDGKAPMPTDHKRFFHPAGKSPLKNTFDVISTWLEHPEWPPLVVTCVKSNWYSCNEYAMRKRNPFIFDKIKKAENIVYHDSYLPKDKFEEYRKILYVVMPSEGEGWGHSIYEAVGNGNIVLTTDEYPMKSHVRNGAGFAVKTKKKGNFKTGAPIVTFDKKAFVNTINKMISLDSKERANMSKKAKAVFDADKAEFIKGFGRIIRYL